MSNLFSNLIFTAQAATPAQPQAGGGSTLLFFGVLIVMMLFMSIYPQRKQMKKQREMIAALKRGDQIITHAGLIGEIVKISDNVITLKVANNVEIQVSKQSISSPVDAEWIAGKTETK